MEHIITQEGQSSNLSKFSLSYVFCLYLKYASALFDWQVNGCHLSMWVYEKCILSCWLSSNSVFYVVYKFSVCVLYWCQLSVFLLGVYVWYDWQVSECFIWLTGARVFDSCQSVGYDWQVSKCFLYDTCQCFIWLSGIRVFGMIDRCQSFWYD